MFLFFVFFFVFFGFLCFFLLSLADSLENVISNKFYEKQKTKFFYQAVIVYIRID